MNLNRIFQSLVPKEKKFFPYFKEQADALAEAADLLVEFFKQTDQEVRKEIYTKIKKQEKIADVIVHKVYKELNSSFITPFDREDIQYLTSELDEVLDYINSAANRAVLYRPRNNSPYFLKMAEVVRAVCYELKSAMYELENVKKNPKFFEQVSLNVYHMEEEADDIYSAFLRDIFENEKDAIELIKEKEIMSALETSTDRAEDVTDVLKAIVIKLA